MEQEEYQIKYFVKKGKIMAKNSTPPFRLFNALTKKEIDIFQTLWPRMVEKLQKRFNTEFKIDFDFNIYYDKQKATKEEVLSTIGEVFHQYYFSK